MNQLRHMSVFAHIVEAGSITAAADSLQLSKSVVSQHLKALEKELGVSLLKRTTRRQTLTPAGEDFFKHCQSLNSIAQTAWQQAQEALVIPKGRIRVTAPNALMGSLVAPAIGKLMQDYPLLVPELISTDAQINVIAENIDLAIRVGASKDSTIKQRRIGQFRDVLCAATPNLTQAELDSAAYIANTWEIEPIEHQMTAGDGGKQLYIAQVNCLSDSFYTSLALIKSGAGVGIIPDFMINTGEHAVYPALPDYQLPVNPVYALYDYNNQLPLNVQVCLTAIEEQLSLTIPRQS